jgi:transposase
MAPEDFQESSRDELIDRVIETDARLQEAEQQLRWFKQQLFGAKSERRHAVGDDPSQLSLGEAITEGKTTGEENDAKASTVRAHERRKPGATETPDEPGLRFDDSVPVKTILVPNKELEELSEDEYTEVTEKTSYRLAQEPAAYVVLRIIRQVVKRKDTLQLSCPPVPPSVLEKSHADVSLLAGLLIDKFRYHLPLYRQHQRMTAAGITVSRSSLTNWVHRSVELLEPIYSAQLASILKSRVLAMDETPIRAGRKSKGKMRTGYFWPVYGDQDEVAFPYASSRAHAYAAEVLGEWCGTLVSDGYDAYERFAAKRKDVVHAECWVHARRGFVKAEDVEPERAAKAMAFIGQLYEIEERIAKKRLEAEPKLQARAEQSRPIVAAFFAWLEDELVASALLPSNPFTKAALYAIKRKQALEVFLGDPDVPMDTNHLERALRVVPMGRKNWLFCWTEVGAEKVGQIQSLLTTCVLHDIDPYTYLVDVLQRVDTHPQARVEELTPRLWKESFAEQPLRSALYRAPP